MIGLGRARAVAALAELAGSPGVSADQARRTFALRARRSVAIASAPATSASEVRPAATSAAVRFTSACGVLPPIVV